jgi:hypothetical protein
VFHHVLSLVRNSTIWCNAEYRTVFQQRLEYHRYCAADSSDDEHSDHFDPVHLEPHLATIPKLGELILHVDEVLLLL